MHTAQDKLRSSVAEGPSSHLSHRTSPERYIQLSFHVTPAIANDRRPHYPPTIPLPPTRPMPVRKRTKMTSPQRPGMHAICAIYSCPNPTVSSTAHVSFCVSTSYDLYGGRSSRLKHVCDFGSCASSPDFSMVNRRGPSDPCKSLKPLTGIRDVPVANCNRRDFCSASQLRMVCECWLADDFHRGNHPKGCIPSRSSE